MAEPAKPPGKSMAGFSVGADVVIRPWRAAALTCSVVLFVFPLGVALVRHHPYIRASAMDSLCPLLAPSSSSASDMQSFLGIGFLAALCAPSPVAAQTQPSLPTSGNALWYKKEAFSWVREYLPIGNGHLGGMVSGGVTEDLISLNIDSLWSGGPFRDSAYDGGNKHPSAAPTVATALANYRQTVFKNGNVSDIAILGEDSGEYGSFSGAGSLVVSRNQTFANVTEYTRWLDLDRAVVVSKWKEGTTWFSRESLCSYPSVTCSHRTFTSDATTFTQTYSFRSVDGLAPRETICSASDTVTVRGTAGQPGMLYELSGKVKTNPQGRVSCTNGLLTVGPVKESIIYWSGGTEYDIRKGDAASGYSFQGPDPHDVVASRIEKTTSQSYSAYYNQHVRDVKATLYSFGLDIGQKPDWEHTTDQLVEAYTWEEGNVLIEWLLFQYGRYLLFSSARGVLPANLQGVWSRDPWAAWSGDYHANINTQQNYWAAEVTNLDVTQSLWDYMQFNWMTRGSETAQILYNATRGWVTHNEMNIFGHTGMKGCEGCNWAIWANYPASGAWMMLHVWDHFDYGTGDVAWLKSQGYPLLKSAAGFWLDNIFDDAYTKDGSLVVNPCNSPEQSLITFGCTHYQQLIWELFNAVDKAAPIAGDTDASFLQELRSARAKLDRGLYIGRYGQIQEWKLDVDSPTDTHRHLSHLIGLYPSYSIASFTPSQDGVYGSSLTRQALLDAAAVTLKARGNGTGPDADSGWEKAWRAASWAQLGDSDNFYKHLKYTIDRNFGNNLFSLYNPFEADSIFQFDANGAYPAALINGIFHAPDTPTYDDTLTVTLLPALPAAWSTGKLNNARLRGGLSLDVSWANGKLIKATIKADRVKNAPARKVEVVYDGKILQEWAPGVGKTLQITV